MLDATFIDAPRGRLFCALRLPVGRPRHTVLVAPAFGDEMNKTRRMVTEVAKRLNEANVAMIVPDLLGTGDSEGSFVEAGWGRWVEDLAIVRDWAAMRDLRITKLLAVRTGAILAAQLVRQREAVVSTCLWQPIKSGQAFVKQMLRLRTVSKAVNNGVAESVDDLNARILAGEAISAGGYELTHNIVEPLAKANLDQLAGGQLGDVHVIDVTRSVDQQGEFEAKFGEVRVRGVRYLGEPYWAATETVCDLNVVKATVEHLAR